MAEEHRCQAPRLCANNCGFFGSPATQNLCSKCYRDLQLKEQQELALNQTLASSSSSLSSSSSPITTSFFVSSPDLHAPQAEEVEVEEVRESAEATVETAARSNRCMTCKRRVGLTGFKCRCGMTFCGSHRYAEQHGCVFDFRGMGKDQIAKANPVVKADKLQKI